MICSQDLRVNFLILHFYSLVGFFPFRICPRHGKIEDETRPWKKLVFYMNQTVTTLHLTFTGIRFLEAVVNFQSGTGNSGMKIHHFGCALVCSSLSLLCRTFGHILYQKHRKNFYSMFNNVVQHFERNPNKKLTFGRLLQMTLQELLAVTVGVEALFLGIPAHLMLYFWNPLGFNFIHSVLPTRWRQEYPIVSLLGGAILEAYTLLIWLSTAHLIANYCILFFKVSQEKATTGIRELEKRSKSGLTAFAVRKALRQCRELQLWIIIFNTIASTLMFLVKLATMLNTIFMLFIALDGMRQGNLMIAGIFFIPGLAIGLVFPIVFNDTFMIPEKVAEFKKGIRQSSLILRRKDERKFQEYTKTVDSIMEIGIKQGGFRVMERTSTPEFIDFAIAKIVDLLITF